jgi:hypothetical protein
MNTNVASVNASRALKVVGIILILSFLVDFVILLFPFQPTNRAWQIDLATALVDRGIVPMVGLGMLIAGYWVDSVNEGAPRGVDLRVPAFILSSILGLLFLLIFPLHLNNVRQASAQTVEQIQKEAATAETRLDTELNQIQARLGTEQAKAALEQQRTQIKAQFTQLLQDDKRYQEALKNPQLPQTTKELLKKFKANPEELEKYIAQQSDPEQVANQRRSQIRETREEAEKEAKERAWRSGVRIGISSLLLSIGYIIIGWTGLKGMGGLQASKRQAPVR